MQSHDGAFVLAAARPAMGILDLIERAAHLIHLGDDLIHENATYATGNRI
jgi:hypothetical protein